MKLNKSEIKALKYIAFGARDRSDLAEALNVTENRVTPILKSLKRKSFLRIKLVNRKKIFRLSNTQPVNAFKKMIIINPGINFSEFLYGFNLKLLTYCLYSWKTVENIAKRFNISNKTVLNRTLKLRERQLLTRKNRMLKFNNKTWKNLFEFLKAYRNFTTKSVNILWKFENDIVFEVMKTKKKVFRTPKNQSKINYDFFSVNKKEIEGVLTGFSAYSKFNVPLNTIRNCCYLPEKKLSKEIVLIHSLMQIRKDVRLLELAIIFFHKNKLSRNKLIKLASKFDSTNLLNEFFKILELNIINKNEIKNLPLTTTKSLNEMLIKYKLKT